MEGLCKKQWSDFIKPVTLKNEITGTIIIWIIVLLIKSLNVYPPVVVASQMLPAAE